MTTTRNQEIDKAIAWIDEHWTGKKACPICESSSWLVGDVVGEMREFLPDKRPLANSLYPMIVLSCRACGYTLLFNATVMGLLPEES